MNEDECWSTSRFDIIKDMSVDGDLSCFLSELCTGSIYHFIFARCSAGRFAIKSNKDKQGDEEEFHGRFIL
jgi:hypothetical protein